MATVWNASEGPLTFDTLASFVAQASKRTPLYIEWERVTTTNDRTVEEGKRSCRPSTIVRMEIVTDRAAHAAYRKALVAERGRKAHRDRREDRQDFRYFVTATLVPYKSPKPADTHYINGYAVPQLAQV